MKHYLKFAACAALAFAALTNPVRQAAAADDDQPSFKVHNTTKDKITKLFASEDGKEYGTFDVGSGIAAGKTITLTWDKKTNDSGCKWFLKAEFEDGEQSPPVKFDFCEDDLELEF